MRKINKVDYFCGAFLSYLIANGVEPTLFEAGEKSKVVEFTIRDVVYKVFFKYSTKKRVIVKQAKSYDTWNVVFAEKELSLLETFGDNCKKVAVICICTDEKLKDADIATWTNPKGGYFISFDVMEGCAKKVVQMCKKAGMVLTGAGATYPYGKDPEDKNIRIAPSFPSPEELVEASKILIVCTKIATIEKMLDK